MKKQMMKTSNTLTPCSLFGNRLWVLFFIFFSLHISAQLYDVNNLVTLQPGTILYSSDSIIAPRKLQSGHLLVDNKKQLKPAKKEKKSLSHIVSSNTKSMI